MLFLPKNVEAAITRTLSGRAMDMVSGGVPAAMQATAHGEEDGMVIIRVLYVAAVVRIKETDVTGELIWFDAQTGAEVKTQMLTFNADDIRKIAAERQALGPGRPH